MRPLGGTDAKDDVGGEERAEQHHFGREEQPDAELAVRSAGVGSLFNGVWDVHA